MEPVEIFRAGTHTAMDGKVVTISQADIVACASAYNIEKHEAPIVIGHPTHDAPAYGWVKDLTVKDASLFAAVSQAAPEFVGMVRDGRFKKVSASFWPPGNATSPNPSAWALRHVGFLGALPPAVMGMKAVALAADEAGAATFETAAFGSDEQSLAHRERALRHREAEFKADALMTQGRILPYERNQVVSFIAGADGGTIEFAASDGTISRVDIAEWFLGFIERRPPIVPLGTIATGSVKFGAEEGGFDLPHGYSADEASLDLHNRAKAYQGAHATDYKTAVRAVSKGR